jgi:hypothetical protein
VVLLVFFIILSLTSACLFLFFKCRWPDGIESKVTLVHENDAAWFITLDETHHEMMMAGKKGSASSGRWVNGSFPWSGERNVVGNFHTTGVYGTTLVGEALKDCLL